VLEKNPSFKIQNLKFKILRNYFILYTHSMINKKKGPGRPQKQFVPTPKAKKAGPGRPKKEPRMYENTPVAKP
jgi:hypothetical protein